MVELPLIVPPTTAGSTFTVAAAEKSSAQMPLLTTALNLVVLVNTFEIVAVVTAISVQLAPPSIEYCHFVIVPIWPLSVSMPLLLPEQMVVLPATVPPTLVGFTVTDAMVLFNAEHMLLVKTAL